MANEQNTAGFTGCPDHLEVWRKQAARAAAADNLSLLFDKLVADYHAHDIDEDGDTKYADGVFDGLFQAYCLVTGLHETVVADQVAQAASAQVPS